MEYKSENRICQNCRGNFVIEPDDFNFYEKIQVPPPTFCPECRFQRRLIWRNDWHLFKKTDVLTGEKIFSIFPEESPVKIYDKDYWMSDAWDALEYGQEFNFSRPFFEQFKELLHKVPLPSHSMYNIVNCSYCANADNIKGCYMVIAASYTEDSAYLIWDQSSRQCFDSHMTNRCELGYGNVNTVMCYKTFFSVDCESCQEMILCKDCVGCNSCIASIGLRNKSYCIFNQEFSREEYMKKIKELNFGSEKKFQELKQKAYEHWLKFPQKFMHGRQNVSVSGDYIYESKSAKDCYRIRGVENSKFIQNILIGPVKDCYDYTNWGDNAELLYETMMTGDGASNVKFSVWTYPNVKNLTYSVFCTNSCSDLFGCISLRKKQYCILNKQYTKEEYEILVPKIIEYMKTTGEYGEFFPASLSPFSYQVSQAYEFFPMEEWDVKEKGFSWYSIEKQNYEFTLNSKDIPDNISEIDKSITKEVIACAHEGKCKHECTGAFRVIDSELEFLKKMNLPLPRLCPNCRHYQRLKQRNPLKLWHRKCMKEDCENEFETSYAPDRLEIIYCEKCYQQEVY